MLKNYTGRGFAVFLVAACSLFGCAPWAVPVIQVAEREAITACEALPKIADHELCLNVVGALVDRILHELGEDSSR